MRRLRSSRVQLVSLSDSSVPLGTITSAPSKVLMRVARMPMSRTCPDVPLISTTSPGCIGRSNIRINPDTKLFTTPCRPKPMPTPSAPNTMVNWLV
ncbi:hypothetical protein D3C71_1442670 [compost metagenome]